MKYMNIIKLLSVLLCIGMLFIACDKGDTAQGTDEVVTGEPTETEVTTDEMTEEMTEEITEEALLENVEPKFEKFFEILTDEGVELTTATRIDGEVHSYDSYGNIIVVKNSDIDTKNNVVETFSVYNTMIGEMVLTTTNTYFNGNYSMFDWDDIMVKEDIVFVDNGYGYVQSDITAKYPESIMDVSVNEYWEIVYITVKQAKITPIADEVRDENPEGCVYEIETVYTYYDVYGNLITQSNSAVDVDYNYNVMLISGSDDYIINFGAVVAYFDGETGKLIKTFALDNEKVIGPYILETEKYGYYRGYSSSVAGLGYTGSLYVVDKATGEMTHHFYFDNNYQIADSFILHNGDLLVQYINVVEHDDAYDYYDSESDSYYEIAHVIFSADDGVTTKIEFPYYIRNLSHGQDFAEMYDLEDSNIGITENARNIGYVYAINNRILGELDLMVFDNDMSVLYSLERIVPEHAFNIDSPFGFELLANGDYLVDLNGIVATKAIVKADGTVRAYLDYDMHVAGGYVYDDDYVYDYDLNKVFELRYAEYSVVGEIFGELVLSKRWDDTDYISLYTLEEQEYEEILSPSLWIASEVQLETVTDEYMIVRRSSDDKYVLYNEKLQEILVTYNVMNMVEYNGGYLVSTYIEGYYVLYAID